MNSASFFQMELKKLTNNYRLKYTNVQIILLLWLKKFQKILFILHLINNISAKPYLYNPQYEHSDNDGNVLPDVDDATSVYWPIGDIFYDGTVHSINDNSTHKIHYNDGDSEKPNLHQEKIKFHDNSPLSNANWNQLKAISSEPQVMKIMAKYFGNKQYRGFQAQLLANIQSGMHMKRKNERL